MSILKNFVNPWESDGGLSNRVLDTNVLFDNVLDIKPIDERNPYRSYCFSEKGTFIGRFLFKSPSGEVLVIGSKALIALRKERDAQKTKKDASSFYINALKTQSVTIADFDKKSKISSSVFSKIYTYILKDHGFDFSRVYKNKLSAYGTNREDYNEPETQHYANTVHLDNDTFKITFNILETRSDFCYVGNIVNSLGAHEYEGHGIERYSGNNEKRTHHKAFEHQMYNHKSWNYTTMSFKAHIVYLYLDELFKERSLTDAWKIYDKLKKKYGKYKEFESIWTYYKR